MQLNPYLSFRNTARDAMEFYQSVFGGTLELTTFGDFGISSDSPDAELVMHSRLTTESGFVLMGADTPESMELAQDTFVTVSLTGDDPQLRTLWDKLSDDGHITVPLAVQMWGDEFGEFTDRFGVKWMVNIAQTPAPDDSGAADS